MTNDQGKAIRWLALVVAVRVDELAKEAFYQANIDTLQLPIVFW
jgi:hypothetical protein